MYHPNKSTFLQAYTGYVEPSAERHHTTTDVKSSAPLAAQEDEFEDQPAPQQYYRQPDYDEQPQYHEQRQSVQEHPLAGPTHPMADSGLTAVAVYDYQAGTWFHAFTRPRMSMDKGRVIRLCPQEAMNQKKQ